MKMNRESAIQAYNRAKQLERTVSERLRREILVPYFGGNCCRQHNCRVNFETGIYESPVNGKNHKELAQLSRLFDYEQNKIWRITDRLESHFAKFF
jgi:hypothetical protein